MLELIFKLQQAIQKAALQETGLKINLEQVALTAPTYKQYGDLSTNIALVLSSQLKSKGKTKSKDLNPYQLSEQICQSLQKQNLSFVDKLEVKNNFINVWVKKEFFVNQLNELIKKGGDFARGDMGKGKKIMIEFAHPNTHKMFHIGHLRNISLGESLVRILEFLDFEVVRANYQGDVGMHIAKCLWGVLAVPDFEEKAAQLKTVKAKVKFLGEAYVKGSSAYEESKKVQEEVKDINYLIYASAQKFQQEKGKQPGSTDYLKFVKGKKEELDKIYSLWKLTRDWSLEYFNAVYQRVYSRFDRFYFESECLSGVDLARQALKQGILKESQGAVIFPGDEHDLETRVFINSLGLPTYEGKELALANLQLSEYPDLDKIIHVVTPEQTSFFKATFKVEELLNPLRFKDKQYHLSYGWVRLKKGKMSSRLGNVVGGEELLDEVKGELKKEFKDLDDQSAEKIAVGAVKYSFLKVNPGSDIAFDFSESMSLQGNSAPYLQYTYARAKSVLVKAGKEETKLENPGQELTGQEQALLKLFPQFSLAVRQAGEDYAPNLLANYLYELAQAFNTFYNQQKILSADLPQEKRSLRILLTAGTAHILKTGLYLLGIKSLEKM